MARLLHKHPRDIHEVTFAINHCHLEQDSSDPIPMVVLHYASRVTRRHRDPNQMVRQRIQALGCHNAPGIPEL